MSRSEPDLPSLGAAWRTTVATAWRVWRFGALMTTSGWFLTTLVAGPLLGVALQQVVLAHGFGDPLWVAVLVAGVVVPEVLLSATDHIRTVMQQLGEQRISHEIIRAALRPKGLEHLENPKYADRTAFIRTEASAIAAVFGELGGQAGLVLSLMVAVVLLAFISPWLLVPVVGAALFGVLQLRAAAWAARIREGATAEQRMADRMVRLGTSPASAADVRMYGLSPWLLAKFDRSVHAVSGQLIRSERRGFVAAALSGFIQALMLTVGLGLLVWLSADGRATPGDVVLGVVVLQTVLEMARGLAGSAAQLYRVSYAARRYLWLLRYDTSVQAPADPVPVPARLTEGIRFESVSFAYPHTDDEVLTGVSLFVPAGSTVALVGANGAGKSTVVKLLCRFYDPTAGRITVDGTDLRDFDPDDWRSRATAGFQDFAKFEFTATESIGVGQLGLLAPDTPSDVRHSAIADAARAGGASGALERLPDGYDNRLGRQFGGAALSEGQWQSVAMSRTILRTGVLLTVLDEPTAALDPRAEHRLFEQFAGQARRSTLDGSVTVLVSHRFSTVSMADLIVVLSDRSVIEAGTHQELLARDGEYRRLFRDQESRYLRKDPSA